MKVIRSTKGFSLVEVLVATFILTLCALSVAQVMSIVHSSSMQSNYVRVLAAARTRFEGALKNNLAWSQTLLRNENLSCGSRFPGCRLPTSASGFYEFVMYGDQPNEKLSFDPNDLTTRLMPNGASCPIENLDPSSEYCPIKFRAYWKPICGAYPCMNPALEIKYEIDPELAQSMPVINLDNYSFTTVRSFNEDSLQSACLILNGIYNPITRTCVPRYAGMSCTSVGRPMGVVKKVHQDGNIECEPLYNGSCNPVTQVLAGVSASGQAICGAKVMGAGCPVNCVGNWQNCSAACGGGIQSYLITTPPANGGVACPFANGQTQACNTQVCDTNCVGSWGACSQPCGGGTMTYTVSTPATGAGLACPYANGTTDVCNTAACGVPIDCAGNWGACDVSTGTQNFTVTQASQNGGAACPVSPRNCAVDCAGSWGGCVAGVRTYNWTVNPLNGGLACPYANGTTDVTACAGPIDCQGGWGVCDSSTGLEAFTVTTPAANGGVA
jgi:prepilin-type N-terminal cleavage/methylation domain-containing protein